MNKLKDDINYKQKTMEYKMLIFYIICLIFPQYLCLEQGINVFSFIL